MLTEKDYCDYETCVALREIGCRMETEWYIHQPSYERGACYLCFGIPRETSVLDECDYIPRLSLYEAQKWLREEKGLHVEVFFSLMDDKRQLHYDWHIVHNIRFDNDEYTYNCDVLDSMGSYKSYEEALSEGIKEAVKILKEYETIH